jgi:hypothetical protein
LLKAVLEKEYVSLIPERDYYSERVIFRRSLEQSGGRCVPEKYMLLAARTTFGDFVFKDASIILHSVIGGDVVNGAMDITTRWTPA